MSKWIEHSAIQGWDTCINLDYIAKITFSKPLFLSKERECSIKYINAENKCVALEVFDDEKSGEARFERIKNLLLSD